MPVLVVSYLQEAIRKTPATVSKIEHVLAAIQRGDGVVFAVLDKSKIIGAIYLRQHKEIICPVLIGGEKMDSWDFYGFMARLCEQIGAEKVQWIGRKGWKGLFPKSRVIGYVYEHEVNAN